MKAKWWVLIGTGLALFLATYKTKEALTTDKTQPRGIRNNNPGNIRISSVTWVGKIPNNQNTDGTFEQFTTFEYGIRALLKNLKNYIDSGINTIDKIISKWAPSNENNTEAYIKRVETQTNINRNKIIQFEYDTMYRISKAIALHENGKDCINASSFSKAWNLL